MGKGNDHLLLAAFSKDICRGLERKLNYIVNGEKLYIFFSNIDETFNENSIRLFIYHKKGKESDIITI